MKYVVVLFVVAIVFSLGSALKYMMNGNDISNKMLKALTYRVGLSLVLFIFLLFGFWIGWFQPHQTQF